MTDSDAVPQAALMDLALQELQERRTLLLEEIAELEKRRQQIELLVAQAQFHCAPIGFAPDQIEREIPGFQARSRLGHRPAQHRPHARQQLA